MYNKITLMGRLVAVPELKTTQNGVRSLHKISHCGKSPFPQQGRGKQGRFLQCNRLEKHRRIYLQVFRQGQYDYA